MTVVTFRYPATPGSRFDLDYYMRVHMPLVRARFGPFGLQSDRVLRGAGAPDGAAAFQITTLLTFPSAQHFHDAIAAHGAEVLGDIAAYTDLKPTVQFNEDVPPPR